MGPQLLAFAVLVRAALGKNATAALPAGGDDPCSADLKNGFAWDPCGNDKVKLCCHPSRQVCLSGTPLNGEEQFECSTNRALYGMKVVTVFIIPMCSLVFLCGVFIIMARQVKTAKVRSLALLCLAQTLLAMLVVFSPLWKFALYSACIAVTVFFLTQLKSNKWVTIVIITLQLFNLFATIGAYGTSGVFVPLGLLSADNVKSWDTGIIDMIAPGAGCSGYYGNYFHLESVEIQHEGADPAVEFHGFCSEGWTATVGAAVASKTVMQLYMLVLSLDLLVVNLGGSDEKMHQLGGS